MNEEIMPHKVYTVPEVARWLQVSEGHIQKLIKNGELKKIQNLGRPIRITGEAMMQYIYEAENKI